MKPHPNSPAALSLALLFGIGLSLGAPASPLPKSRLIILADMGNEPDEEQQMTHMLMYSNEFEITGLLAVTGLYLRSNPHPELFLRLLDGYEKVVGNLRLHAAGWPEAAALRALVKPGQSGYGMAAVGAGKSSPGSDLILAAVGGPDPRPVHIVVNAGSNTLAQALFDYSRTHGKAEVDAFVAKLRVYENGAQDDAGAMITHQYPGIVWLRSNYQTYAWGGKDGGPGDIGPYVWQPYPQYVNGNVGPGEHQWAHENIQTGHGALGALYPDRKTGNGSLQFLEGGGTTPWIGLANHGLSDPEHPAWGGWSGRFAAVRAVNYVSRHPEIQSLEIRYQPFSVFPETQDRWIDPETGKAYQDINTPVYRWRRAMFNDLKGRMDWCVNAFQEANHNPVAAFAGDMEDTVINITSAPGQNVALDASASRDPDGDSLDFSWYPYPEAGTYPGALSIPQPNARVTRFLVPGDAGEGDRIHLVLEVRDRNPLVPMYDYRRIIVKVTRQTAALRPPTAQTGLRAPRSRSGGTPRFNAQGRRVLLKRRLLIRAYPDPD